MSAAWQEASRKILDTLDLRAEYAKLGLDITGATPNSHGWLECRCLGQQDRSPSAGINVGGDHPSKGRYKEFAGEGRSLSFFEFAALAGGHKTWQEARKAFAKQAGVHLPAGSGPKDPADGLVFRDWNASLIESWCLKKPPIAHWAVRVAGGKLANWPASTEKHTVVALPVFGLHGADDSPIGWVIWNKTGAALPLFQGKGSPPRDVKMLTVSGSKAGWMNQYALIHLEKAEVVWKVEGPGDMLALQTCIPRELLGTHLVITNSGGCMELPRADFLDCLAGKKVYVVHDCDQPGQQGGDRWSAAIAEVAGECRHVRLPYDITPDHGHDVRDFLNDGHSYAELLELAAQADVIARPAASVSKGSVANASGEPAAPADPFEAERLICQALNIDVLGERPDGKIRVFCATHGKTVTIDDIGRLSYARMLQAFGPPIKAKVHEGNDEIPGMYHLKRVREAIALIAGSERAGMGTECGLGVWKGEDGKLVLVGAGRVSVWDGCNLETFQKPRAAGIKVDIDSPPEMQWYDPETLEPYLRCAGQKEWVDSVIDRVGDIFDKWCYRNDTGVSAELITGLIMASMVQAVWDWRPQVGISGPSDCGKSKMLEIVAGLMGKLALLSAKSSEAGIRQALGHHSNVIICDEFESDKNRKAILELFRTGSRGSQTLRGNTAQTGARYGLRHIPWMAAIELGMERAPDRNRVIMVEMAALPKGKRGKVSLPSREELSDLGQRLLAIAIRHVLAADEMACRLRSREFEDVDGRVVESYSVVIALLAVASGRITEEAAGSLMQSIFARLETDPSQGTKDETDLLGDILSTIIELGRGDKAMVSQVLEDPDSHVGGLQALERVGIAPVWLARGPRPNEGLGDALFIAHKAVKRYLLKGTMWEDQTIDTILKRLPGARKMQVIIGGHRPWGVRLPWSLLSKYLATKDEKEGF